MSRLLKALNGIKRLDPPYIPEIKLEDNIDLGETLEYYQNICSICREQICLGEYTHF